jgi:drug/metabolite transporter (DMT)-like permease
MVHLILCIVMTVIIFISFRSFTKFRIDTFQAIVFNYLVCVITGTVYLYLDQRLFVPTNIFNLIPYSFIMGLAFIGTFNLMALTTQKLSITVASVSSKMSLIIPVLFSLLIFGLDTKQFDFINYAGIMFAILAVSLSSFKREQRMITAGQRTPEKLLLPVAVFLLSGMLDTSFNYLNINVLKPGDEGLFSIIIFAVAALIGFIIIIIKKQKIRLANIIGGIYLGIPNYFSIYFLILALTAFENDGAMVFPLLNIGTILLASLISVIIFQEKLLKVNKIGIFFAICAIIMLSHQEILNYLFTR